MAIYGRFQSIIFCFCSDTCVFIIVNMFFNNHHYSLSLIIIIIILVVSSNVQIINSDKSTYIEKIAILSTKPYKGHEYLKIKFNEEVNSYLKKIINTNPESLFSKIILPYLEISPTSENKISNDLILKIKETKLHLENKNIENALVNLKNIDNYENIFEETYLEINKYIIFKKELLSLK